MSILSAVSLATVALLVGGALAVSPASAPLGPSTSAIDAATGSIVVSATSDYGYQPDTFEQVPINATITVTFTDDDPSGMQHSFNLSSREGFVIPTTYSAAQLDQLFKTYPTQYSSLVNYTGDQVVGTFHSPATPGWYEFVCNVSGHFQNGMYGFVAFGENLPANLTHPSRVGLGGGLDPFDAGLAGVLVLAVVLAMVVLRRRRPPPRT